MRITFVALNYAPSRGGAQELVRHLAEGLAGRGHEVEVLTTDALRSPGARDRGHVAVTDEMIGGVRVRRFGTPQAITTALRGVRLVVNAARQWLGRGNVEVTPWLYGPWSPGLMGAVRRATRSSDIVIGCTTPFTTGLAPGWFRRGARARVVMLPLLHVSSSRPHPAVRRGLRRSDRVVALTQFEADVAITLGVDRGRVAVIPAGTDPDAYPELSAAEARRRVDLPHRPTVGFIGRLAAYKGIDTLLAAAPELWEAQPDTTVLIAGSPSGWDGYRDPGITALAGDRLVVREGFAPDQRALLLAACDVVVHPSREESFGMVAIESWAARRPIVAADIPAVRCLVEPGRAGELVPPGDAPALARTLIDLLADPERRRAQGATGRADVEERFSWEQVGAEWQELVLDVAAQTTVGGR